MKAFTLLAACLLFTNTGFADDWKTTDGKIYQNVHVVKVEADCVTILDSDGGARIDLAKLQPDLQKRFGYDPEKAKAAADRRAEEDRANAIALQAEQSQADAIKKISKLQQLIKLTKRKKQLQGRLHLAALLQMPQRQKENGLRAR
jgi:hypothetical protein